MFRRSLILAIATAAFVGALGAPSSAGERQTAQVAWMPPSGNAGLVDGAWASLVKHGGGASYNFHAREVEHRHTYTIWWVIFNHPENCETNPAGPVFCGANDLAIGAVEPSVQFGGGNVAGGSGRTTVGGSIGFGDTRGCEDGLPCNDGLTNPDAEIHLVLRTHGEAVPGWVDYQISSFNGACNPGEPNEGQCRNLQAAAFAP